MLSVQERNTQRTLSLRELLRTTLALLLNDVEHFRNN